MQRQREDAMNRYFVAANGNLQDVRSSVQSR